MNHDHRDPTSGSIPDDDEDQSRKTKRIHVHIPWGLAERVRIHAVENSTTMTNVVIEALDTFLRSQKR